MKLRVALLSGILTCAACAPYTAGFRKQLLEIAGDAAFDCGSVPLSQPAGSSATCATEALAARKPFFVAFQVRGIDSQIWDGLALGSDGQSRIVRFDSDPSGGHRFFARPRVSIDPCSSPKLPEQSGEPVECGVGL